VCHSHRTLRKTFLRDQLDNLLSEVADTMPWVLAPLR
jgi:hypothetical protein